MDGEINETEENKAIATQGRNFYVRHKDARVLRRQYPDGHPTREVGVRAERNALKKLISTIEEIEKSRSKTHE